VSTFLLEPDAIDSTNWRAEQALRPWSRARSVAATAPNVAPRPKAVLASVLRMIQQREFDADDVSCELFGPPSRSPHSAPSPAK
jgi:hypothetical protein